MFRRESGVIGLCCQKQDAVVESGQFGKRLEIGQWTDEMPDPRYRLVPLMRIVLLASLALVAGLWVISLNRRPSANVEYFPKTGHNVKGEFLKFFQERGGLAIFGFPITEEFDLDGRTVQYFQRVRMELHPENGPDYRAQLGLLGEELNKHEPPIGESNRPPPGDPDRRYFAQTGHIVGFSFLRFFDENGGVDIFGYPITEVFEENGRRVQYFQRARMEFPPDRPAGQQVRLADLGEIHFVYARLDPSLRRPVASLLDSAAGRASGRTALRLEASVATTYVSYPGRQTLHVYVTDDKNEDVSNARVTFIAEYPGVLKSYRMDPTDESGHTALTFDVEPSPVGQKVTIRVTATLNALTGTTQVSFFIWQ